MRVALSIVLGLVLGTGASHAQPPPAAPEPPPTAPAPRTAEERPQEPPRWRDLTGWVVDAETGWPLARAVVQAEGSPYAVRTDATGRFGLRTPATRPTVITVACPGYAPLRLPLRADQPRAVFHLVPSSSTRTTWPVTLTLPDR
ncbi:MAG: carboxypeptidase regulatory-like domain-containing protein [Bacteroidota bacterium]